MSGQAQRSWTLINQGRRMDLSAALFPAGASPLQQQALTAAQIAALHKVVAEAQLMAMSLTADSLAAVGGMLKSIGALASGLRRYGAAVSQSGAGGARGIYVAAADAQQHLRAAQLTLAGQPQAQAALTASLALLKTVVPEKTKAGQVIRLAVVRDAKTVMPAHDAKTAAHAGLSVDKAAPAVPGVVARQGATQAGATKPDASEVSAKNARRFSEHKDVKGKASKPAVIATGAEKPSKTAVSDISAAKPRLSTLASAGVRPLNTGTAGIQDKPQVFAPSGNESKNSAAILDFAKSKAAANHQRLPSAQPGSVASERGSSIVSPFSPVLAAADPGAKNFSSPHISRPDNAGLPLSADATTGATAQRQAITVATEAGAETLRVPDRTQPAVADFSRGVVSEKIAAIPAPATAVRTDAGAVHIPHAPVVETMAGRAEAVFAAPAFAHPDQANVSAITGKAAIAPTALQDHAKIDAPPSINETGADRTTPRQQALPPAGTLQEHTRLQAIPSASPKQNESLLLETGLKAGDISLSTISAVAELGARTKADILTAESPALQDAPATSAAAVKMEAEPAANAPAPETSRLPAGDTTVLSAFAESAHDATQTVLQQAKDTTATIAGSQAVKSLADAVNKMAGDIIQLFRKTAMKTCPPGCNGALGCCRPISADTRSISNRMAKLAKG